MQPPPVRAPPGTVVPDVWTFTPVAASYTALGRAFLTPLLAWPSFSHPTSSVALNFAPLKRCAGASVVRSCPSPVGASTPRHQAQLQLPRVRHTGFSHRVGASMANGLRPLYCPWPRCFVYLPIAIGAALRSAPPQ